MTGEKVSLVTPLRGVTFSLALCAISNMAAQSPAPSLPVFRGLVVSTIFIVRRRKYIYIAANNVAYLFLFHNHSNDPS